MIKWLKSLFGFEAPLEPTLQADKDTVETQVKSVEKPAAKKSTKSKSGKTCNFDKLTKTQLLKEAKHRGIKANASLSKAEILKRLKNG